LGKKSFRWCIFITPRVKGWKKEEGKDFLATSHIVDSGESIFDNEYFREFDAKIEKALSGTYAELINTRNIKTGIIVMPLSIAKEIKVK
jgi:hypothetical protein